MEAKEIISLYGVLESEAANFRRLYQDTADLVFPRENQIISTQTPGTERNTNIVDETGVMAMQEMATGLSINLFPPGQKFYDIKMSDRELNEDPVVKRYLGVVTEISHEKRNASNFRVEADETLKSISAFGTGNLFSEYVPGLGLNYRDYDIGQYVIQQNSQRRIDTVFLKFPLTAVQAFSEWGDAVGEKIKKALEDEKAKYRKFMFIVMIRPRSDRNRNLKNKTNMPFEKVCVSVEESVIVEHGGYEEFPHFIPRWSKSSNEVWGRGQGTFALPSVRTLQQITRDYIECGNRHNNPPKEVLESFDGTVKVSPGALNWVSEMGSIRAIEQGALGNFPITREVMEFKQEQVRKMFFNDVFVQLANLKGDRRTTLEIRERLAEGLQRLGPPVGRLQEEWLKPLVIRDIFLLLRNGELPPLPEQLQGASFKIEFVGRLAMQLKGQKAQGFLRWAGFGAELAATFPDIVDNIEMDSGFRRLGESLGVGVEDIATEEEVEEKREARAQAMQEQKQMELATLAAQNYSGATKSPEEGSPAEALMNGA